MSIGDDWFAYDATQFDTVELNHTFYRASPISALMTSMGRTNANEGLGA